MKLTTRDLAFKDLAADLACASGSDAAVKVALTAPRLNINALDPRLNLLRAAGAPGVPLDVNGSIVFTTPLKCSDAVENLHRLLGATATASDTPGERRFTAFEKLALSGSVKVPTVQFERSSAANVDVQNFSLKALKLSIASLGMDAYGGRLVRSDADFDLTKGRTVEVDGKPTIKGVAHEQKLALTDADLGQLLGISGTQGYAVGGRATAQHGTLKGSDFFGVDRLSWNGAIKFRIAGITVATPQRQPGAAAEKLPPWMIPIAGAYGESFAEGFRAGTGGETVTARELWNEKSGDAARPQHAFMLALQAYLSKLIGFESDKLEFEAIEPTIEIDKGSAKITSALQLVGKGSCEGLELTVKNLRVNLATEAFNDDAGEGLIIYPTAVPRSGRARLHLDKWPPAVQTEYLKAVTQGSLPLRVYGQLAAPVFKFPWADVRTFGRRALFDMERIGDLEALERARQNLLKQWGAEPDDLSRAALVADRLGVGLPGTQTARDMGESCIERVTGMPQSLFKLLSKTAPVVTPVKSLQDLLHPEPDPVPPGGKKDAEKKNG
ncbi:MAG TPA: hypothetical protein VEJ63_18005, partial [Planctomycetota bacterium]|nr:hypothetical protein [Planctomycetota bacterium]